MTLRAVAEVGVKAMAGVGVGVGVGVGERGVGVEGNLPRTSSSRGTKPVPTRL